jgi:hypothetical protein
LSTGGLPVLAGQAMGVVDVPIWTTLERLILKILLFSPIYGWHNLDALFL